MNFSVVQRGETLVAGTVLRSPALAVEGSRRKRVEEVWQRTLARTLPGYPATAYVDHAPELNSYLTHIAGYRCHSVSDVVPGDVLARIPAGNFARFVRNGDNLGDTIAALWRSVWDAEAEGELVRAYTGDFERYPDANTVEVFVALADKQAVK
ncbi:effector binding domain-containing protein [Antrihabitans sp. YC2-6]|uniref:GyrI-like domain-containing protein n=1 Tax=Antrihabitans sp. YC2-6 TaxID=2799498 RepID=UPI0018F50B79|nr:effector binding domain-containing protein [Antrihabitans sp. YC2-6]MBJ8347650.1 effector binding domain-containing protein [Antrihabitans sp. YC2-6]